MKTLAVELPDDVFAALRRSPAEVSADVRLAAAIEWHRRGLVSQCRAAEIAGVSRADFLDALAARKIEASPIDIDELEGELNRG
jgi:predicted HTH domain antitoxin